MYPLSTIFSLFIAAAGWYYTFHSRAAEGLASTEARSLNQRRVRLRQLGGCAMMALAVCFFAGFHTVNAEIHPGIFIAIWLTVFFLLAGVVSLALMDLRLTLELRRRRGVDRDVNESGH